MRVYSTTKRGFFLLEMSIALVVSIIAISLLVPSTLFFYKTFIDLQLEHIKTVCTYLHHKSIIQHRPLQMMINLAANTLHTECGSISLQGGIVFGVLPLLLGPPSKPQSTLTKASSFVNNTIYFYPDGTASAGALYITDAHAQWQYALTISVNKGCCIRKYIHTSAQWHSL